MDNTTTVYLIRHAAYENPDKVIPYRLSGFPLSEVGKRWAQDLAQFFDDRPITTVYASPILRTDQTATIIAQRHHIPMIADERLIEVRSPAQGKPEEFFVESMGGWNIYNTQFYRDGGGETLSEIFARMDAFLKEKVHAHMGQEIIAVSHGDPIMVVAAKYQGKKLNFDDLSHQPYVPMGTGYRMVFDASENFIQLDSFPSSGT